MAFRNIVLLSDGTGNSSISPTKTNVWRLFESLDLGPNAAGEYTQFGFYDDGVGTSGFKVLRILGGGFGWGLSRNVRELYCKLCREYEPGDRIYIFGFSRGAFTARVLAHFIIKCGILDRSRPAPGLAGSTMESERGLMRGTRQAYKAYRRGYWDEASNFLRLVSKPLRFLRNLFPRLRVEPPAEFKAKHSHENPSGTRAAIEFIGVFDTVDALGLPLAELRTLIDRWVYPYKFPNQILSAKVGRACQALAVDDERQTFHPLLWDETDPATLARPNRLKQVWFSGMHSNVGGSYPEDNLAHIALDWMIDEVKAARPADGLVFNRRASADFQLKATPLGKLYDSRRGAAMYYRYGPRDIHDLSNQAKAKRLGRNRVSVPVPKIHHSVLDRIADLKVGYAPTALPPSFHVVLENGIVIDPDVTWTSYSETPADQTLRREMAERAKGHIFWRRIIYVFLLICTLLLVLMPYFWPPIPGLIPEKDFSGTLTSVVGAVLRYASGYLPGFASYWTDAWTQSAGFFIGLLCAFVVLFVWRTWVRNNLGMVAEAGWWHMKGFAAATRFNTPPGFFERNANRFRSSAFGKTLAWLWLAFVMPYGFALLCLLIFAGALYRALWHYPLVMDGVCNLPRATLVAGQADTDAKLALPVTAEPREFTFVTTTPCFNTGVELEAGKHYEVSVSVDSEWRDKSIAAEPSGFISFLDELQLSPFIPMRRHLSLPWFALTGEIGSDSGYIFPVDRQSFQFIPATTGTLYLHVNDAIAVPACPIWICPFDIETWDWDRYYRNNAGSATVSIAHIKP